jgi:hypothetical protein
MLVLQIKNPFSCEKKTGAFNDEFIGNPTTVPFNEKRLRFVALRPSFSGSLPLTDFQA